MCKIPRKILPRGSQFSRDIFRTDLKKKRILRALWLEITGASKQLFTLYGNKTKEKKKKKMPVSRYKTRQGKRVAFYSKLCRLKPRATAFSLKRKPNLL